MSDNGEIGKKLIRLDADFERSVLGSIGLVNSIISSEKVKKEFRRVTYQLILDKLLNRECEWYYNELGKIIK